jgi:hypothetical protein
MLSGAYLRPDSVAGYRRSNCDDRVVGDVELAYTKIVISKCTCHKRIGKPYKVKSVEDRE